MSTECLVEVANLQVVARGDDGAEIPIVKDVSFSIRRGEVLALIGESGSGKTTIALTLLGYARRGCRIAGGRVGVGGTDVLAAAPAALTLIMLTPAMEEEVVVVRVMFAKRVQR